MEGSNEERLRRLFEDACDLDTGEQRVFLRETCTDEPELRERLEALLDLDTDEHEVLPESDVQAGFLLHSGATDGRAPATGPHQDGLADGQRVGNYTILGRLGAGGMGTVYEARQESPRRIVALKMLNAGVSSRHLIDRFRQEGQILGRLDHIGIGRIFESGFLELNGVELPFYSMQRIEGESITKHVASLEVDRRGVVDLVAKVCDALHHAHDKGVIHRDLKPDNILVDTSGQPKLLDFGVARIIDSETWISTLHTRPGQLIGTLPYMSPEQVSGHPDAVDHRSDIYAVGVLLYRLLTRRLPHDLSELSIPQATRVIQDEEPTRLRHVDKTLRGDLETIVERCLAKESGHRYGSAGEVASDLRRHLAHLPIGAKPITNLDHWRRFARRHKGLVAGTLIAFVALVVGLTVALWQMSGALLAREASRQDAYHSTITGAAAALEAGNVITARELLEEVDPELRQWEWRYYTNQLDRSLVVMEVPHLAAFSFDPGGESFWTVETTGLLSQRELPLGAVLQQRQLDAGPLTSARFSADSMILATRSNASERVALWDVPTGAQRSEFRMPPVEKRRGASLAIDPEGSRVAWPGNKFVYVAEAGKGVRSVSARLVGVSTKASLALHGDHLIIASNFGDMSRVDLSRPQDPFAKFEGTPRAVTRGLRLSSDGSTVALASRDLRVRTFDVESLQLVTEFAGHTAQPVALAFNETATSLVSGGADQTLRVWDGASGLTRAVLSGHEGTVKAVEVSPDGRFLLTHDSEGKLRLWRVDGSGDLSVLGEHDSFVYPVAVSPRGDTIASGSWDGTVRLWSVRSGTERQRYDLGYDPFELSFSPDGSRLAVAGSQGGTSILGLDSSLSRREIALGQWRDQAVEWKSNEQLWIGHNRQREGLENLNLVDVRDGQILWRSEIPGKGILDLALSPDGSTLAVASRDGVIRLLDAETHELRATLEGHDAEVHDLAFGPKGERLISGSADSSARVWDVKSGATLQVLGKHRDEVRGVAFSADGLRVATACDDTLVRVFDPVTGQLVATLDGHQDYVYSIDFAPAGDLLVSGSGDGTLRTWDTRSLREQFAARNASTD